MSKINRSHGQPGDPKGDNNEVHHIQRPYWTRAHRDWRVWVGVVFMLAAMIIYIMTENLAWGPHLQPQPGAIAQ